MTERARWEVGVGGAVVRATRIVGEHETQGEDRERRYVLDFPARDPAWPATTSKHATVERERDTFLVTVPDGARLARVRVRFDDDFLSVWLPGPTFGDAIGDAVQGDRKAAKTVLNTFDDPVTVPFRCASVLDLDGVAALLSALADVSQHAADAFHGARYDILRTTARSKTGLSASTASGFERFAARVDDVDALGSVDPLDALAGAVATAPDADAADSLLTDLGYNPHTLAERDDGRFLAVLVAKRVLADGREAGRNTVRKYGTTRSEYDLLKSRALNADYWERGEAWRQALEAAITESVDEFSFALANALHWSGEVSRADSRIDELLHEAAAEVAAETGLAGVEGRARYACQMSAGHRHRGSRNHDLAVQHFDRARSLAADYDFLDAWEPLYSRSVVRSNQLAARGRFQRAVDVLDDALDALDDHEVPSNRREEVTNHLRGQKREREAVVDEDDPGVRRIHLEAAREHYERGGFDRSADRVDRKLGRASRDTETADSPRIALRHRSLRDEPRPSADGNSDQPTSGPVGEADAVGSADPGVLPDERGDRDDWY